MSAKTKFEIVDGLNIKINASLSKEQYNTFKALAEANGGAYDKESKLFTFQDVRGATGTKTAADLNAELMEDFKNVELVDSTIKINSMSKPQFTYLVKTAEKNNGTYDKDKKSILFQNAEDAVKTFSTVFKEAAGAVLDKITGRKAVDDKELAAIMTKAQGYEWDTPITNAVLKLELVEKNEMGRERNAYTMREQINIINDRIDYLRKHKIGDDKKAKAKVGFEQDGTKVSANGFLQKWEFAIYATVAAKNGGKYDTESKGFVFQDVRGATDFTNEAQKDFKELSAVYSTKPQAVNDAPQAAEQASTASNVRRNR